MLQPVDSCFPKQMSTTEIEFHRTNKSYTNNNMPFLFNDLILFCISMSPLQVQILDKPIHFFLQTYSIREYISQAQDNDSENKSSHFKADIFQPVHFNQYSANIYNHVLKRRHYYAVNSYLLYPFYILCRKRCCHFRLFFCAFQRLQYFMNIAKDQGQ